MLAFRPPSEVDSFPMDFAARARPFVVVGVAFASFSAILVRLSDAPPLAIAFYRMLFTAGMLLPFQPWTSRARSAPQGRSTACISQGCGATGPSDAGAADGTGNDPAPDGAGGGSGPGHAAAAPKPGSAGASGRPGRPGGRGPAGTEPAGTGPAGKGPAGRLPNPVVVLSGLFLGLHFGTWITSLSYTSVASAVVLVTLHPMFVALGSVFLLKEHLPAASFAFIALAIGGSALLSYGDFLIGGTALFGNALAVAGALAAAGYMLAGRVARRTVDAAAYNFQVYLFAAIALLAAVVAMEVPLAGYALREWLIFAALAFFCTILGHSVFNWALRYVQASFVSTSILLEPIFATLLAIPIFGELPTPYAVAGGIIVVLGLYGVLRLDRRAQRAR